MTEEQLYASVGGRLVAAGTDPASASEGYWDFGWVPPELRTDEQHEVADRIESSLPKFAISGRSRDDVKKSDMTKLWSHPSVVAALGYAYEGTHQKEGSCVGAGAGNVVASTNFKEVIKGGDPEKIILPFYPYHYGQGRLKAGFRGRGHGSHGLPQAEAIREFGVLDNLSHPELPKPSNSDGLIWGSAVETQWSAGDLSPNRDWVETGRKYPIRTIARARSANDVRQGLVNLYASSCASMYGFNAGVEDGILLGRKGPRWAHQMCLAPDTKIPLLDGSEKTLKEIADSGEKVWIYSYDPTTGRVVPKETEARMTRPCVPEGMVRVTLDNGESITSTLDHRYLLRDGTWVEARHLKPDDSLMPLYRRDSTAEDCEHRVGYEMVSDPCDGSWVFTHKRVAEEVSLAGLRYKDGKEDEIVAPGKAMAYIHHRDFDKRNNTPGNLAKMLKREHWKLHADLADPSHLRKARLDPEYNRRQAEAARRAMRKLREDPAFLENLRAAASENMKRQNADPEYAAKRDEAAKRMMEERFADPAEREKARVRLAERKKDPEFRRKQAEAASRNGKAGAKKVSLAAVKRWSDPEYRRKMIEACKEREARKREARQAAQAEPAPNNHKVASVVFMPTETGPTYCLKVDGTENFAVSAGVFVHNSFHAFWEHPKFGPIYWLMNQWGKGAHGACPTGMVGGGAWILESDVDWICKSGEVIIFSDMAGYPAPDYDVSLVFG